tara:strand:+ start:302 stop:880 length:579 start_codon:yes stop_codon:yes gene_type:complete
MDSSSDEEEMKSWASYWYKDELIAVTEDLKYNILDKDILDITDKTGKLNDFIDYLWNENKKIKEEVLYHAKIRARLTEENKKLKEKNEFYKEVMDNTHFCDKCGMSDDNPNSHFNCECGDSDSDGSGRIYQWEEEDDEDDEEYMYEVMNGDISKYLGNDLSEAKKYKLPIRIYRNENREVNYDSFDIISFKD